MRSLDLAINGGKTPAFMRANEPFAFVRAVTLDQGLSALVWVRLGPRYYVFRFRNPFARVRAT